ncbi:MAG: BON domain-containing protein, partial [Bacteroidota bacterium]
MKRLFSIHKNLITLLTIAVLALTPGFAGDAYAQDRDSQMIDDADITEAINVKLAIDERIDADNIEVSTQDYIVILEGYVADIRSKELAVSISQSIRGVKSVVNNIDVMAIRKADLELKRDVSEALAMDDVADKYQIEVEANDGVVTLNGMVESFAEKQITENVAKNVSGVKEINNNLQVDYDAKR